VSDRPRVLLTQRVEDLPDRGERRDAIDQQWAPFLESQGLLPVPLPNLVADVAGFVDPLDVGLVVLTGGNDLEHLPGAVNPAPERDRTERALLDLATERGIPVLGVCRGLQHLAVLAGGTLAPVEGHRACRHPVEVVAGAPWPLRDGREVNSFHDWGIRPEELGDLVPLAHAPDGTVEAACHPTRPQVGIMWHPERDPADDADRELIRALLRAGR
jgi:putative glutamine amidotransferase